MERRNIKLVLQYDGTAYHGFQRQPGLVTVQELLEKAIKAVTGEEVRVTGAGRTDAGVHARGQVVNFHTAATVPDERFPFALNSFLPPDVVVVAAQRVPTDFHARRSAKSKVYRYSVLNRLFPCPFLRRYAYHVPQGLNLPAMMEAAAYLVGRHDFASFRAAGGSARTTTRTLMALEWRKEGDLLHLRAEADGFLYHMVRAIVGTLLEVGRGKLEPEEVRRILEARNRDLAGPTAPPHGLCLEEVRY